MARKLKTFVTSMGFFDLAVAAPSMKAALEAWGVKRNLFQQGLASQTDDRAITAAAMAKPGAVLKRAVGTSEPFHQDADLPAGFSLPDMRGDDRHQPKVKKKKSAHARKTRVREPSSASIISFEKARAKRERARAKEEKAARRDAEKRASALEKAEAALDAARKDHQARREKLQRELDRRLEDEESRWNRARAKLEAALDKARRS